MQILSFHRELLPYSHSSVRFSNVTVGCSGHHKPVSIQLRCVGVAAQDSGASNLKILQTELKQSVLPDTADN